MPLVHRVAQGSRADEGLLLLPVVVEGVAEQDAQSEVDVHQVRRDQLAVDDDAGRHEGRVARVVHALVGVVHDVRVLEGAPAAEQGAPVADLRVLAVRDVVEEVEEVVGYRDDLLYPVHAPHQPHQVVGEELRCRARCPRRRGRSVEGWTCRPSIRQNISRVSRLICRASTVGLARKRVEGAHEVRDGAEAVDVGVRGLGRLRPLQPARVRLPDHLLAVVHEEQVVLVDGVVEHKLGRLTEVHDPLAQVRRLHPVGHVLGVDRADRVVVPADAADAAGDEVRVARVLALHEHAVAAEERGGALALHHLPVVEVYLGVDPQVADDARDRVPRHVHDVAGFGSHFLSDSHCLPLLYARQRGS